MISIYDNSIHSKYASFFKWDHLSNSYSYDETIDDTPFHLLSNEIIIYQDTHIVCTTFTTTDIPSHPIQWFILYANTIFNQPPHIIKSALALASF